jgi:5-methylcytosine-specific restriction protein B
VTIKEEYAVESKSYLSWVEFYSAFATSLLDYFKDRKALIAKLQAVYKNIGLKFPKVDSSAAVADIDPFTIFGLFNKGITDANRIAILNGIAKEFSITAPVPTTFDGIPVLNNLNATFYRFVGDPDRGEHDIDNLWSVFAAAIAYADNTSAANRETFITAFDVVKDLKGNRWKLTMGLYWVRPMQYINLDSRNRWFIENPENMQC